jgi:hypothetical protein
MARSRNRYSYNPETGEFTLTGQIYVPSNPSNPISTQYTFSELKKIANSLGVVYEPEDWIDVSFATSWANFNTSTNTAAQYYIDPFRRVHIKGVVVRTSGNTIFTLPAGYRPSETHLFVVDGDGAFAEINIQTDGAVVLAAGTAASYLSLDGISFRI